MNPRDDTYEWFLAGDRRRRGNALEIGHDFSADDGQWRVCWYEETGELTLEGVEVAEFDVDDFHAGISGPVQVLGVVESQRRLETLLGRWPAVELWRPRTVDRLRQLIDG